MRINARQQICDSTQQIHDRDSKLCSQSITPRVFSKEESETTTYNILNATAGLRNPQEGDQEATVAECPYGVAEFSLADVIVRGSGPEKMQSFLLPARRRDIHNRQVALLSPSLTEFLHPL